jgi:hypothetical protein
MRAPSHFAHLDASAEIDMARTIIPCAVRTEQVSSWTMKSGDTIKLDDGRDWRVLATGATDGDAIYVHLASVAMGVLQKNGHRPLQVCGWLRGSTLTGSL